MRKPALSILAVVLSTACGPGPSPVEAKDLEPLNQELSETNARAAFANKAHFSPLCDEHGYPLVGNIVTKTSSVSASELCAAIRNHGP